MSETKKPRLCEILGVEVNEPFTYPYVTGVYDKCWIDENGIAKGKNNDSSVTYKVGGPALCWLINHPEKIVHLPPLTEPELAICKAVGARWVSIGIEGGEVRLSSARPGDDESKYLGEIIQELFPSLHPGDCVEVARTAKGVASDG